MPNPLSFVGMSPHREGARRFVVYKRGDVDKHDDPCHITLFSDIEIMRAIRYAKLRFLGLQPPLIDVVGGFWVGILLDPFPAREHERNLFVKVKFFNPSSVSPPGS